MKHHKWNKLTAFVLASALIFSAAGCGTTGADTPSGSGDGAGSAGTMQVLRNEGKVDSDYDIIVVGTDPEGISAALSAARSGMKTLLLSQDTALGGLYTLGELNFIDVPEGPGDSDSLVEGIYKEFSGAVGGSGFDIVQAADTFKSMIDAQDNITLRVNSKFQEPVMDGSAITGVTVKEDGKTVTYNAPVVIDATQDGDVAAAAGAPYTYAGEDIGERDREMGVTLVFRLSGVDWDKVVRHLTKERVKGEVTGSSTSMGAVGNTAWGYSTEGFAYEPSSDSMRLRGLNMAKQENGDVLINALIIFDVDPLDEKSRAEGIERGQKELEKIVPYLSEKCVGFENAKLAGTAEQLYVRESRHITCDYSLTIDDEMENRDQEDGIAVTSYPVDIQATKTQTYGTVVGWPNAYAIPYRSLLPQKVEGLMVVGRSAGYTSVAAGSARIVPTGMACGEAAGLAAKVAKDHGMTVRELSKDEAAVKELRERLKAQGVNLTLDAQQPEVMSHWAYEGVKVFRSMGILDGGYDNNYRLDEAVSNNRYQNLINNSVKKAGFSLKEKVVVNDNPPARQIIGTMARTCIEIEGAEKLADDNSVYLQALKDRKILNDELETYFSDLEAQPNAAEVIMLVARFYSYLLTLDGAQHYEAIDTIAL